MTNPVNFESDGVAYRTSLYERDGCVARVYFMNEFV